MIRSAVRFLLVAVSFVLLIPSTASASSILISIDRLDDFAVPLSAFGVFLSVEIDAPDVTNVAVTAGTVEILMELTPDGVWEDASENVFFRSLTALESAVSGTWTIVVTGGADASTSSFTINDSRDLRNGDFLPIATGLSPADGATEVSATTLLSWTAVPSAIALNVFAGSDDTNEQEALNLLGEILIDATSWQPPLPLPAGPGQWGVFYAPDPILTVDLVGDISVTTGTIDWVVHGFAELAGVSWPASKPFMVLGSESIVQISVPEPAEVLQSGVALATLGLLASLRSRKRGFGYTTLRG
jgi:hypothetical protein